MKLTRRGKVVVTILAIAALIAGYWVESHIWWTATGYCWGSMERCVGL
jgi:hypothetical protein